MAQVLQHACGTRFVNPRPFDNTEESILYSAHDTIKNETVIIKIQNGDSQNQIDAATTEAAVYEQISTNNLFVHGFLRLVQSGEFNGRRYFIFRREGDSAVARMEASIPAPAQQPVYMLPLHEVPTFAMQAVRRIEALHDNGFVHRDIRPSNFIYGPLNTSRRDNLYIFNFGLARQFCEPNGDHVPFAPCHDECRLNLLFAPEFALRRPTRFRLGRKHDLESLMYVLVYLVKGTLPWDETEPNARKKISTQKKNLVDKNWARTKFFQGCPPQFEQMFHLIMATGYSVRPDYNRLVQLLAEINVPTAAGSSQQHAHQQQQH
ncbi:MAG: hypothetical protein AAGJ35_09030 [Myxococcota bacterium]